VVNPHKDKEMGEMHGESIRQLEHLLPVEGTDRLERYLDRCDAGFPDDLRTPLYQAAPREEIIKLCEETIGFTRFEELTQIDEHERDKVGPFSIMLPAKERLPDLEKYWKQTWHPDEECLREAFEFVSSLINSGSLRPASYDTAYSLMPKDTSLGLPWLTRDRAYADLYFERAVNASSVDDFYPCVWYWRGQPKGLSEIPKQRVVWGMDHAETIKGATILYPTLDALRRLNGFSAWLGAPFVDEEATRLLSRAQGRRILSMDYSSFDSSLPRELLDLVDQVLSSWFVESASAVIRLLGELCATVPIVVPYSVLSGRNGGMPSGSVMTNLRDTLANLIAGYYCASRHDTTILDYMVLGDDAVYLFKDEIDPRDVESVMGELGLECNPDKQFISSRSCHYLQRWHSLDYVREGLNVGVHSPYRTLSGLTGYERFRTGWNKYMDTARWIMQVENCAWDPRFHKFVTFLYHGDRVLQSGMDPAEIFKRAGGADMIRSVLNIASFPFNVKNPDRVNEFKTTKLLREIQGTAG